MKTNKFFAAIAAVAALVACNNKEDVKEPAEVSVSPASVNFEADGGTLRVAVTTNAKDYTVEGAPEWLSVEKNGKEIALSASQNTVNEVRSANLLVKAAEASCQLAVSQKAGSPYPGFTVLSSAEFQYGGTILYMFLKPTEENYGGQAYLVLEDEEGNGMSLWIYTDLFESEEDVVFQTGTYTKGNDNYPHALAAKPFTFCPGSIQVISDEEGDEHYTAGSYYASATSGEEIPLVDGTIEVSESNGVYTVKVDMVDEAGKAYKYVYIGEVPVDTEGAGYPGENEHIDVASTVFAADYFYYGSDGESTYGQLVLYSGDAEAGKAEAVTTNYAFFMPACEFSEDMDLSGQYMMPEEMSEVGAPGTIVPGSLVELFPGFSMPDGTYVIYGFDDYLIADTFASLILEKKGDGSYTLMGALMSSDNQMVMFMNIPVNIEIINDVH